MTDPLPPVDPQVTLSRFPAPAHWATRCVSTPIRWSELVEATRACELWPGGGGVAAAEALLPAWSFARYREDARVVVQDLALARRETILRVLDVGGLMLEYEDEPSIDPAHLEAWWKGHLFLAYTTAFHNMPWGDRPPGPRWRVILPFSAPVSWSDALEVAAWARHPRHQAGMIAETTLACERLCGVPAMVPGGFAWLSGEGTPLDPQRARAELVAWREADEEVAARATLADAALTRACERLGRPHDATRFGWAGPPEPVSPLPAGALRARRPVTREWRGWEDAELEPGRIAVLLGVPGVGRTALAVQLAAVNAEEGHPVLYVALRAAPEEVIARLLARRSGGEVPWAAILDGRAPESELVAGVNDLVRHHPSLFLWAPEPGEHDAEVLAAKVRAAARLAGRRAPLVVLDAIDLWSGDPAALARTLAALARRGGTDPDWPGAAFFCVDRPTDAAPLRDPEALRAGAPGPLDEHPLWGEATFVLGLAAEPEGSPSRHATLRVLRSRVGSAPLVDLRFWPATGLFTVADGEPVTRR